MKNRTSYLGYLVALALFVVFCHDLHAQEIEWAVAAHGLNEDRGSAVSADENYIYHAGDIGEQTVFGDGEPNETLVDGRNYVARYFHDGTLDWVASILSTGSPLNIHGIDSDHLGNVYITGEVFTGSDHTFGPGQITETTISSGFNASDLFIAKFRGTGVFQWVRVAGINEQNGGRDIVVDNTGASYTTGYFRSNIEIGAEGSTPAVQLTSEGGVLDNDIFVVKFDTNGDLVWGFSAGGSDGADTGRAIELDHKNNIYLAGSFRTQAVFSKNTKYEQIVNAEGESDGFLARFSRKGQVHWVVPMGGASSEAASDIAVQNGKTVVLGSFYGVATFGSTDGVTQQLTGMGTDNLYIARYNRSGVLQWTNDIFMDDTFNFDRNVGYGEGQQSCVMANFMGMATFGAGTPRETVLNSPGDPDMYFACYSANGVFQWVEPDPAPFSAGTMTGDGEIIVTGGFQNNVFFGPLDPNDVLLSSDGGRDIYLAKYLSQPPELGFTSKALAASDKKDNELNHAIGLNNYPNPFNPSTTIRFDLASSAQVSLKVYDVTGKEVANLINGSLDAGSHEASFDASQLPSGLYIYRLNTPAGQFARVMSLMK